MKCAFCEDENKDKRVIIKNELACAFLGIQPIVVGHTLIIPKRCVAKFEDLTENEKSSIFNLMKKVKSVLEKTFNCEGFNIAWNENLIAGQTVPHFHLHVIPRKKGDKGIYKYEPRDFLYRPGSRANSKIEELQEIAKLIKNNF